MKQQFFAFRSRKLLKTLALCLMVMLGVNAWADDTRVIVPSVDGWVRNNSSQTYNSGNMEARSKSDGFIAVMRFDLPQMPGKNLKSATLRLVTRTLKSSTKAFTVAKLTDLTITRSSTYDNVNGATTDALATFTPAGYNNKRVSSDGGIGAEYQTLSKWVNTITLDKSKITSGEALNIAIYANESIGSNSTDFFTKRAAGFTNSNHATLTATYDQIIPQLTLVYEAIDGISVNATNTAADTWVWNGNSGDRSSDKAMEIYTKSDGNDLAGLIRFQMESDVVSPAYEVTSATLRLVTERKKGADHMNIFAYGNLFNENTNWATEETNSYITNARATTSVATFAVKGEGKALTSSDKTSLDYTNVEAWTNYIDLTDHVKSLKSNQFALLLSADEDNADANKIFTKDATDISKTSEEKEPYESRIDFKKEDLYPLLTVVYKLATYDLEVTSAGAATLVLPFTATIPAELLTDKIYTLSYESGNNITATAVTGTTLTANTPVLVVAPAGTYTFTSNGTYNSNEPTSGELIGNYDASWTVPVQTDSKDNYILQNKASGLGFYKVVEGQNTLSPNRAYLSVSHANAARGFLGIRFGGDITDIQAVENEETGFNDDDAPVYNMSGMLMQGGNLPKGFYVKRGKKFVVQ